MMATIIALSIVAAVIGIGFIAIPTISEWLRQRSVVRDSEIKQKLKALDAAEHLSALAWRARNELYELHQKRSGTH